jgi:aminoglycoside phosphotransferase (APT) family kinase protein
VVNVVVRVGDTVRRRPCENHRFVHRLLELFAQARWGGAPRFLGFDEKGREVLSFVPGHVDWDNAKATPLAEEGLAQVARLTRAFHDLTAGSDLAGGEEVVCHNDLAPRNCVYRSAREPREPFAFIDWDNAAPGRRIEDVAHVCWQFIVLGPANPDPGAAARHARVIVDAYGLGPERGELVETIFWWQDRSWRWVESRAAEGDAAMITLRDRGAVTDIQASVRWTRDNRSVFEQALQG